MMQSYIQWLFLSVFAAIAATAGELAPGEQVYNQALERAKATYDREVKLARDSFVRALKAEQTRLTQKGDLEGAIKFRDKIASLDKSSETGTAGTAEKSIKTPEEGWESIKAQVVTVYPDRACLAGDLPEGRWKIIPAPGDTWRTAPTWPAYTADGGGHSTDGNLNMALMFKVGNSVGKSYRDVVVGPGKIFLYANDNSPRDNVGTIRVKIVREEKEEGP
jgi:hypothetical protein